MGLQRNLWNVSSLSEWYSSCIAAQLDEGKGIENVEVQLKLSVLKPVHAQWIMDLFNYFTSEKGREVISNVWKAAFITEALSSGSDGLEPLDPFQAIDPLTTENSKIEISIPSTQNENIDFFVTRKSHEDDNEEEWDPWGRN